MKRVFAEFDQDFHGHHFWSWDCPACGHYGEEIDEGQKSKVVNCDACKKAYLITFFHDKAEKPEKESQATAS